MKFQSLCIFSCILIKVSGATACWPFTDSAVPSSLLLLFLLRSAGLQPADLLLILLFLPHYYYSYYYSHTFSNPLSEATIKATELKFAHNAYNLNIKNDFWNFCDSTSGFGNIRIIREIAYALISLQPMIWFEWKLVLWKEETKASFLYDIQKDEQLPVPVVFVQYINAPKASYL